MFENISSENNSKKSGVTEEENIFVDKKIRLKLYSMKWSKNVEYT